MKKGLIVLLVLLTGICLFADGFSVDKLSAGANIGFASVGTAKLKTTTDYKATTGIGKYQMKLSGFALGINGTYQIDNNYSVEAGFNFVLPSKFTAVSSAGSKDEKNTWTKKEFKDKFGSPNFFGFKMNAGVGYILRLDVPFDVKVGGGLQFSSGSAKGTKFVKKSLSAVGLYGFGKLIYPIADHFDVIADFNFDISLSGKIKQDGKKIASGTMFNPSYTFGVGAVYNF